jgi:uncharacterized protein (DUF1778 family)
MTDEEAHEMLTGNEVRVTLRLGVEARERIREAARREGNSESAVMRRALLIGIAEILRHLDAQGAALTKATPS